MFFMLLALGKIGMQNCKNLDLNSPKEAKMSCDNLNSVGEFKSCDMLFCIPILARTSNLNNTVSGCCICAVYKS